MFTTLRLIALIANHEQRAFVTPAPYGSIAPHFPTIEHVDKCLTSGLKHQVLKKRKDYCRIANNSLTWWGGHLSYCQQATVATVEPEIQPVFAMALAAILACDPNLKQQHDVHIQELTEHIYIYIHIRIYSTRKKKSNNAKHPHQLQRLQ